LSRQVGIYEKVPFYPHAHSANQNGGYVFEDVRARNALGDGIRDDTADIQWMLDNRSRIYFPPNLTWLISASLTIPSNRELYFGVGSTIKLKDNAGNPAGGRPLLTNNDWTNGNINIRIYGVNINGNKANNIANSASGIIFEGVRGFTIRDFWIYDIPDRGGLTEGDGLYFCKDAGGHHNDYGTVHGGRIDNCMRNGISIIDMRFSSFQGMKGIGNIYSFIDIEPNGGTDRLVQLSFEGFHHLNGVGYGFILNNTGAASYSSLLFSDFSMEGHTRHGFLIKNISYALFQNLSSKNNSLEGDNLWQGIELDAVNQTRFVNIYSSGPKQEYGIKEIGASNNNQFYNTYLVGNKTGASSFVGGSSGIGIFP
jgi:hypothetical protein